MEKFQSLKAIQDTEIVDSRGEYVGYIHDLLLDTRDGRVEYVCIALQTAANSQSREVVIPWSALRIRKDDARWQIAARKRILDSIAQPVARRPIPAGRD